MITEHKYLQLRDAVETSQYAYDIKWAQDIEPVASAIEFWNEYAWVVLNSGMKNQVARMIWDRVRPVVVSGGSAATVFKHKGKAAAIDTVYAMREVLFAKWQRIQGYTPDSKLVFLRTLPWIGPITCYHLAKNFGADVAKPDRHLVRIAGEEGAQAMCERLAKATGDKVCVVDTVIWRAANMRLI